MWRGASLDLQVLRHWPSMGTNQPLLDLVSLRDLYIMFDTDMMFSVTENSQRQEGGMCGGHLETREWGIRRKSLRAHGFLQGYSGWNGLRSLCNEER